MHADPLTLDPLQDPVWQILRSALTQERDDVLPALRNLHARCLQPREQGQPAQPHAAALCAHAALVMCLLDMGAMDDPMTWVAQTRRALPLGTEAFAELLWWRLGAVVLPVLGDEHPGQEEAASLAAAWLQAQLRADPLRHSGSGESADADQRLLIALVLVNHHLARQRYEQFDALASQVQAHALPGSTPASPLMQARWLHSLAYAHYQVGRNDRAETHWADSLALARSHGLHHLALQNTLALVRLQLDTGRVAAAAAQLDRVDPRWGAGRMAQLVELQQLRARRWLLSGQATRALACIDDALALAAQAGWPLPECAACLTDRVQVWIALQRETDAGAELARLASQMQGRDRQVFQCLHGLLAASLRPVPDAEQREGLQQALRLALALRYTMFWRLLPGLAARCCLLALQQGVETVFVTDVIALRKLPAPADAGIRWPWPLWLQLLGGFEIRRQGVPLLIQGKTPHKPLELLRWLACSRELQAPMTLLQDTLWPDADAAAARKNLETTVQRLRRLLGDDSLLRVSDGRVSLDGSRCRSDVQQRRIALEALERLAALPAWGDGNSCADDIDARVSAPVDAFVDLTRGELLPGAPSAPWLEAERETCAREQRRAVAALQAVANRHARPGPLLQALAARLDALVSGAPAAPTPGQPVRRR